MTKRIELHDSIQHEVYHLEFTLPDGTKTHRQFHTPYGYLGYTELDSLSTSSQLVAQSAGEGFRRFSRKNGYSGFVKGNAYAVTTIIQKTVEYIEPDDDQD